MVSAERLTSRGSTALASSASAESGTPRKVTLLGGAVPVTSGYIEYIEYI